MYCVLWTFGGHNRHSGSANIPCPKTNYFKRLHFNIYIQKMSGKLLNAL